MVAHWIRKAKRKVRRKFKRDGEVEGGGNIIDLSLVSRDERGDLDEIHVEQEISGSKRSSAGLTCPQMLAVVGAVGALPQVALGNAANLAGLPDWKALSDSLRKAKPMSMSAPILTVTAAPGSPNSILSRSPQGRSRNDGEDNDHRHHHHHHKGHHDDSSESDIFSISHRNSKELGPFRAHVRKLVESKPFQQGILGAILINTLSMGVEYHDQVSKGTLQLVTFSNQEKKLFL